MTAAVLITAAAVSLLFPWYRGLDLNRVLDWAGALDLSRAREGPPPGAEPQEVQTLPPLKPAAGPNQSRAPAASPGTPGGPAPAGTARLAPLIVPIETGGTP